MSPTPHTGIPMEVQSHDLATSMSYAGPVMDLAAALSDLPCGGQTLLGPATLSSIAPRLAELGVTLMMSQGNKQPASKGKKQGEDVFTDHMGDWEIVIVERPFALVVCVTGICPGLIVCMHGGCMFLLCCLLEAAQQVCQIMLSCLQIVQAQLLQVRRPSSAVSLKHCIPSHQVQAGGR